MLMIAIRLLIEHLKILDMSTHSVGSYIAWLLMGILVDFGLCLVCFPRMRC